MNNIIFVDIDGPLLPQKMHLFPENHKGGIENPPIFDHMAVRIFNLWAKYGKAKIVFSTSWAFSFDNDELKRLMKTNGLGFDYHADVTTPKHMHGGRLEEILDWLSNHLDEVNKFIIVDDDTNCRHLEEIMEKYRPEIKASGKWIKVDFHNGISWENFVEGCNALGIDMDDINEQEFGIKRLSKKEKDKRDAILWSMT